jgi:hypothetical protein
MPAPKAGEDSHESLCEGPGVSPDPPPRLSGFNVVRSTSLDLDETEHVLVPADQINLPMMPRRAEVSRHHDVSAPAQIEISIFLAAPAGGLVGGDLNISRRGLADNAIEAMQKVFS